MEQETQTEVAVINPELNQVVESSKVEISKAHQHAIAFAPAMQKVNELSKYLSTLNKESPSAEDCKMARINRLALVKNRTGAEAIKDERKSNLLVESKLIDNLYGVIKNTSLLIEGQYEQVEKFAELKEKERKEKLRAERLELLREYSETPEMFPLGEMTDKAFDDLLSGLKLARKAKLDAELKMQEAFREKERIDNLHNERKNSILNDWQFLPDSRKNANFGELTDEQWQLELSEISHLKKQYAAEQEKVRLENEKLKKAAESKEKEMAKEREAAAKAKAIADAQAKAEKDKYDALVEAERKKAAKVKADADAKLLIEKQGREKLEAELKAKQAEEEKRKSDQIAASVLFN